MVICSEIITVGYGEEYSHEKGRYDDRDGRGTEEDKEVYAAEDRVLNPSLWIEDFLEELAFLVIGYPGLVFVGVTFADACEGLAFAS